MTPKEAVYRELRYAVCGAGGVLEGIVEPDHVKLDVRIEPDSLRSEDDYPWLIFRAVRQEEIDELRYAKTSMEISVIGLRSSASKGDTLLELIRGLLIDEFSGTRRTRGKFAADGTPDPDGGLLMSCTYRDTVENVDRNTDEKHYLLVFDLSYLRP